MKAVFLIFILLLLVSCEAEDVTKPPLNSLDSDVEFFPKEVFPHNEQSVPELGLFLRTTKEYPCYNYGLSFSQSFEEGKLTIVLEGIYIPEGCFTAFGPAEGRLELPESTRELIFEWRDQSDRYEVSITDEQVEITPVTSDFTNSLHPVTFRYPEDSFAVVCGTNLEQFGICGNFLEILQTIPGLTSFSFPEEGRVPHPTNSSGNWNNTPSRYFIYENEAALEAVMEQFDIFVRENLQRDDGNSLGIFTWDNRSYYSYQQLD